MCKKPAHDNRCDDNHPNQGRDHEVGHHNPVCGSTPTTVHVVIPPHTTSTTIGGGITATTSTTWEGIATHQYNTVPTVGVATPIAELPNTGASTAPLGALGIGALLAGVLCMRWAARMKK